MQQTAAAGASKAGAGVIYNFCCLTTFHSIYDSSDRKYVRRRRRRVDAETWLAVSIQGCQTVSITTLNTSKHTSSPARASKGKVMPKNVILNMPIPFKVICG
jgi:hypothetical protein